MNLEDIPEFELNSRIFELMHRIDSARESCRGTANKRMENRLRKAGCLRSVNSSLSIEGNGMDILRMRDVINGKKVEGPFDEILETQNAMKAYEAVETADLWSVDEFLRIHDILMFGCVPYSGFRSEGVCICDGTEDDRNVIYVAPRHELVGPMVSRLFDWCRDSDYPAPITAAIAHFYIESIHPFPDGNGRIGRLWHTAVLRRHDPVFGLVPLETVIRRRRDEYYRTLERCQHMEVQDCTGFIELCLEMSLESLTDLRHLKDPDMTRLMEAMGPDAMTANQIMERMGLKHKPYFLKTFIHPAMEYGLVSMTDPDSPHSRYQRYRRIFI